MEITNNLKVFTVPFNEIEPGQMFSLLSNRSVFCKLDNYSKRLVKDMNAGIGYDSICVSNESGDQRGYLTNCSGERCIPANSIHITYRQE